MSPNDPALARFTSLLEFLEQRFGADLFIRQQLSTIIRNQEQQMANEQNLQDTLDTIKADVTIVVSAVTSQLAADQKQIADLKAQLAAGSPVSPEQLDALEASAQSSVDLLQPLVDSLSASVTVATEDAAPKPKPPQPPQPPQPPTPPQPAQASTVGGVMGEKALGDKPLA